MGAVPNSQVYFIIEMNICQRLISVCKLRFIAVCAKRNFIWRAHHLCLRHKWKIRKPRLSDFWQRNCDLRRKDGSHPIDKKTRWQGTGQKRSSDNGALFCFASAFLKPSSVYPQINKKTPRGCFFVVSTGQFRCRFCVSQFRCTRRADFSRGKTGACKWPLSSWLAEPCL